MFLRRFIYGIIAISLLALIMSCNLILSFFYNEGEISVTPENPYVPAGDSIQLRAQRLNSTGAWEDITSIAEWDSSAEEIATVSEGGLVTGVLQGNAAVQARAGSQSDSVAVNVTAGSGTPSGTPDPTPDPSGSPAGSNPPWSSFFGGSDIEAGVAIARTSEEGYILTGSTSLSGFWVGSNPPIDSPAGANLVLIKLAGDGSYIWHTFFGGTGAGIIPSSIIESSAGEYVIAGSASGSVGLPNLINPYTGIYDYDIIVLKFSPAGNCIWYTFLGGAADQIAYSISEAGDGNYVISGNALGGITSPPVLPIVAWSYSSDIFLAKLSMNGDNLMWHTYKGALPLGQEYANSMIRTSDGGFVVAGHGNTMFGSGTEMNFKSSGVDILLAKFDGAGNCDWHAWAGGTSEEMAYSVVETQDSGYVVTGSSDFPLDSFYIYTLNGYSGAGTDTILVKFDYTGNYIWHTYLGGSGDQFGTSIVEDGAGNLAVIGFTNDAFGSPIRGYSGSQDLFLARFMLNGGYIWHTFIGGAGDESAGNLALSQDEGFVFTGASTASFGSPIYPYIGTNDILAVKVLADGSF